MASTLLSTILCLNLVASVSYLVFRALAFAGRKHISEKWRYNCITIIMCLYVIPFYKLLPGFPQAFTQRSTNISCRKKYCIWNECSFS